MKINFNYKIGGIIGITMLLVMAGTLTFTQFQTNSSLDSQTQTIGIGAYVTVKAYHQDGELFQKFEGHNELALQAVNDMVGCISGLSPLNVGCDLNVDRMKLLLLNQSNSNSVQSPVVTASSHQLPAGCTFSNLNECNGWNLEATFDFDNLECTPTVDCFTIGAANAIYGNNGDFDYNSLLITEVIPIIPNDRVVVSMNFTIPR